MDSNNNVIVHARNKEKRVYPDGYISGIEPQNACLLVILSDLSLIDNRRVLTSGPVIRAIWSR